jgi:hypothetical protein
LATVTAHAADPITIGGSECGDQGAMVVLGERLESLPTSVNATQLIPLGTFRGLRFGLVLHPHQSPEVSLNGATTQRANLSRDHHGPRAVLNALDRLAGGYKPESDRTRQELAIVEGQLRDYESRLGAEFPHESYLAELTALRDRLKAGLSGATPEPGTEATPSVPELAARIKAVRAANTIEATPQRIGTRRSTGEEPVTARIRRKHDAIGAGDSTPDQLPTNESTTVPHQDVESRDSTARGADLNNLPVRADPGYRTRVAVSRREQEFEASLP